MKTENYKPRKYKLIPVPVQQLRRLSDNVKKAGFGDEYFYSVETQTIYCRYQGKVYPQKSKTQIPGMYYDHIRAINQERGLI